VVSLPYWVANYDEGVPHTLAPYPERTLLDYLTENAEHYGDRVALLFKGRSMSYRELDRLSTAFAAALAKLGISKGDRVALILPNCPQFLIAEIGAWKVGAIITPLNPTYSARELAEALNTTGARTAIVLSRFYEKMKEVQPNTAITRVISTNIKEYLPFHLRIGYTLLKEKKEGDRVKLRDGDLSFSRLIRRNRSAKRPQNLPLPHDIAVILMSGGTTGTPKGVAGAHRGMVIAGIQLRAWLSPVVKEWDDSFLLPLPLFHTYANTGLQSLGLINHNPIALIPNPRELREVLLEINSVKPAFICAVPTLLNAIMNHPMAREGKVDFSSIKLCFCGAAALMAETQKRFEELTGGVVMEGYSLTEAQMAVIANPVRGEKKLGSVGMPLPDIDLRIIDAEDGKTRLAQGETGEIVISAPQLMVGYWERPEETREMLRSGENGERLLFTGDLGYVDEDGYLFIVDRKKDLIKTSGYQVWPREVEEVISKHPAVAEVGVAGLPDQMRGEVVKAWVVLREGMKVSKGDLKLYSRDHLAPYKVPSAFEFVAELPKSAAGKVLRRVLKETELAKGGALLALLVIGLVAACNSSPKTPSVATNASVVETSPIPTAANSAVRPSQSGCAHTGLWSECSIERRLRQSGFVVTKLDEQPQRAGFTVKPVVYQLGSARLEVFLFPDEKSLAAAMSKLDTVTVSPIGTPGGWETAPVLVRSGNLAAVFLGRSPRQAERVSLALTAGAPQPGSPR
jgi:long-chain acyl-CoA synthetase